MSALTLEQSMTRDASLEVARSIGSAILDPSSVESNVPFYGAEDTFLIHRGAMGSHVMPANTASCVVACSGRMSARTSLPVINVYPRDTAGVLLAHLTSEIDEDLGDLFSTVDTVSTKLSVGSSSGEDKNGDVTGGVLPDIDQGFEHMTASRLKQYGRGTITNVVLENDGVTMMDVPKDGGCKQYRIHDDWTHTSYASRGDRFALKDNLQEFIAKKGSITSQTGIISGAATIITGMQLGQLSTGNYTAAGWTGASDEQFPNDVSSVNITGSLTLSCRTVGTYFSGNITVTMHAVGPGNFRTQSKEIVIANVGTVSVTVANETGFILPFDFGVTTHWPVRGVYAEITAATSTAEVYDCIGFDATYSLERNCSDLSNQKTLVAVLEGVSSGDVVRVSSDQLLAARYAPRVAGSMSSGMEKNLLVDESRVREFIDDFSRGVPSSLASSSYDRFSEEMVQYLNGEEALEAFSFKHARRVARRTKAAADRARTVVGKVNKVVHVAAKTGDELGIPGSSAVAKYSETLDKGLDKYDKVSKVLDRIGLSEHGRR